jgi:hypothetical protein
MLTLDVAGCRFGGPETLAATRSWDEGEQKRSQRPNPIPPPRWCCEGCLGGLGKLGGMHLRHGPIFFVLAGLMLGQRDLQATSAQEDACFILEIENPGILNVLPRQIQGELLILTAEPLDGSPGATEGARAYMGKEEWARKRPLQPFSWYWTREASDSIQVGLVLPLWGITWRASETDEGMSGEVTYMSDEAGEPPRTSQFTGTRVECELGSGRDRIRVN